MMFQIHKDLPTRLMQVPIMDSCEREWNTQEITGSTYIEEVRRDEHSNTLTIITNPSFNLDCGATQEQHGATDL
eukprot:gnl/Chilomastix_caulleri/2190.p1 GENE.gnl/Chilomastix_caulleri/2190~~gnl/Chilomastix_caulleri/2190.p1  ORF type:complete len:74 (+),score=7.16 gnl/Chilomastix_caulleri/2190:292-513(+)